MKRNVIIQKSNNKKLVISNQRKNLLQKISSVEKRPPSLTQFDFYKLLEENKENEKKNPLAIKETNKKHQNHKKHQSQQKSSICSVDPKEAKNNLIIDNQRHFKNLSRAYSMTPASKIINHKRRRGTIVLQHSSLAFSPFSQQIQQIYDILNQSFVIQAKSSALITLKKEKFHQILVYLLEVVTQHKQDSQIKQEYCISLLEQTFEKIRKKINHKRLSYKSSKMTLKSNIARAQYTNQEYQDKVVEIKANISQLSLENQVLVKKLYSKKEQLQFTSTICREKQEQVMQLSRKSNELSQLNKNLHKTISQTQLQILNYEGLLKELKVKADNLLTFVQKQQDKKILHSVSQAYKQIESEIYDYACYLQCNSMASSLIWEPKPFRAVQKWVYEQMERVNHFVMSKAESFEDKCTKMIEFITNTTRKFRNKDEQMMKITDYKTECIKKYIKMMQKWLENWQLKQEYLVSLRNEFVIQSEEINQLLTSLGTIFFEDISKNADFSKVLQTLKGKWKKVELNYKYGNSFY